MQQSLSSFSELHKQKLEIHLKDYVNKLKAPPEIKESMLYSLEAGGKRIRPMLLFASLAAFGEDTSKGLWTAAAIEMVHTYSLIHDDLPSMDNDDLRRGKPTNHKVFGEAFAILAGDALLTYSFQTITETPDEFASAETKLSLIKELSKASGAEGMVGGQAADIKGEGKQLGLEDLEYIHVHKTGKLLECSVVSGAILANASQETLRALSAFAYHLGLAFQIRDDILDLEGTEEIIGKPVGSDESKNKSTYPSLLTINGAKEALENHIRSAKEKLRETGLQTELLEEITDLIANRDH
ncbi:polyprenyl synthetase family protein [Bacillus sp. CMF12]|uniref:polyprenyl synthetase family protein n=1 Tax=Bacillaceae TaxID=186817 RepID=UPI001FB26BB4|nr:MULTISPECIES: farnesyl diphosphate synthase [Bacillaceae]UOE54351.1 polyprenyl synthetase family protein [Cytobacillus oceanisediminis]USK48803.1 polyprenyl synthetase family protein [Bacillus sp. CMF12]